MKQKSIFSITTLVLAIVITMIFVIGYCSFFTVRWDKIPFFGAFFLEIDKPSGFDATSVSEPIRWDQIDDPPEEYDDSTGLWFWFNPFTKDLLKQYMRENNLGIVPGYYPYFHMSANFEECMETFEFIELDESYRDIDYDLERNRNFVRVCGVFAAIFWIIIIKYCKDKFLGFRNCYNNIK